MSNSLVFKRRESFRFIGALAGFVLAIRSVYLGYVPSMAGKIEASEDAAFYFVVVAVLFVASSYEIIRFIFIKMKPKR